MLALLFSKVPGRAPVKTRLRDTTKGVLEDSEVDLLAAAFLADSLSLLDKNFKRVILAVEPLETSVELQSLLNETLASIDTKLSLSLEKFIPTPQVGNSFWEKLESSTKDLSKEAKNGIQIFGSDCPLLGQEQINTASKILKKNHSVLGPTPDGGLFLIGLSKNLLDREFEFAGQLASSSKTELEGFKDCLDKWDEPAEILSPLPDVDVIDDLAGLISILEASSESKNINSHFGSCPFTREAILSLKILIIRSEENTRGFELVRV